jgi:hypothetical protein
MRWYFNLTEKAAGWQRLNWIAELTLHDSRSYVSTLKTGDIGIEREFEDK